MNPPISSTDPLRRVADAAEPQRTRTVPDTPARFFIGDIGISAVNLVSATDFIRRCNRSGSFGYICVTNSRTTYLSNTDEAYCQIQNNSLLSVPDGMPLVWIGKNRGLSQTGRVSGQDLMEAIFEISDANSFSHYFYGCSPETIDLLQTKLLFRYPDLKIKAAVSPPFQPVDAYDIPALAAEINRLKPTFFWCGLGAPKQEILISRLQPHLDKTISIGVGLAFEYLAGTVKRAPVWMQKNGLEWIYRDIQQPKKLLQFTRPFFYILKENLISLPLFKKKRLYN